ncbi:Uncharacterized protein DAT39_015678 [Clarias magur]|uniref:Uncharacterized protein n=1 Tax=Clarias magur TaxID=1594786 RepID=A0A8J4WX51_CLAMG|nr:Uncharacterized protein DAT39_015678 [Clarias magur]
MSVRSEESIFRSCHRGLSPLCNIYSTNPRRSRAPSLWAAQPWVISLTGSSQARNIHKHWQAKHTTREPLLITPTLNSQRFCQHPQSSRRSKQNLGPKPPSRSDELEAKLKLLITVQACIKLQNPNLIVDEVESGNFSLCSIQASKKESGSACTQ